MKNFKIRTSMTALIAVLFLWSSCKKEESNQTSVNEVVQQKFAGVIPDDPIKVSKVPLIVSADYAVGGRKFSLTPELSFAERGGKADRILPTITIISPSNSATVSGIINILVSATDNVGVKSVSLFVDGASVSSSTTSPFTITWNSGTVPNGTHTLALTASDASGNKATASIQITVNNVTAGDIISPTISIGSPANGASFNIGSVINISSTASDNVGVSSVSISIDNIVVSNSSAYSWNTSSAASGFHTIKAIAKDAAGNQGSSSITISLNTVVVPPPPPSNTTVQLTMPPVSNQGGEGSCVAFAVGYAARSAEQYYRTNASSYSNSTNIFSPEFLYNQIKFGTDCGSGSAMQTGLDFIVANGIPTFQSMPYSATNGCSLLPNSAQSFEALNYKISAYSKLFTTDKAAIQTMINQKHPVIVTILADNSFINATTGFIWKTYSGSGSLPHCIVICGYDDTKNAYKIMNSWGTTWGDAGFSWIDYDFFLTKTGTYCYAIN
jgi:hypothetical protein